MFPRFEKNEPVYGLPTFGALGDFSFPDGLEGTYMYTRYLPGELRV